MSGPPVQLRQEQDVKRGCWRGSPMAYGRRMPTSISCATRSGQSNPSKRSFASTMLKKKTSMSTLLLSSVLGSDAVWRLPRPLPVDTMR